MRGPHVTSPIITSSSIPLILNHLVDHIASGPQVRRQQNTIKGTSRDVDKSLVSRSPITRPVLYRSPMDKVDKILLELYRKGRVFNGGLVGGLVKEICAGDC